MYKTVSSTYCSKLKFFCSTNILNTVTWLDKFLCFLRVFVNMASLIDHLKSMFHLNAHINILQYF